MINVAIVGYGNVGKYVVSAIQSASDFKLTGIVRRSVIGDEPHGIKIVDDIQKLNDVDVAILCTPTRNIPSTAKKYLTLGINTVDSFDIHSDIWKLKTELDIVAKEHESVAVISAGWDPGSDSIVRALLEAASPNGITYTNFGPGMSMGHTVAVKAIDGVKNALSMTIPLGTGLHRRVVYVEANGSHEQITAAIKSDKYFINDETHVIFVDDIEKLMDVGHGVSMTRKGVSAGKTHNQLFEFSMRINNPALTAQIMLSCARATTKQKPGAYTMIELPVIDLLPGNTKDIIERLV